MYKLRRIIYYFFHKPSVLMVMLIEKLAPLIPDKPYLKLKFRLVMGSWPNLNNPQTFNEKLQWLKLYNRCPQYTLMVDKVKVKKYVAEILGEEYVIPTLGVWDNPNDIDFDALPNRFVLKCNHNSGTGMCICKEKSKLNIPRVKAALRKGLKENYYLHGREWPYKNVPRKILAEQFIEDKNGAELLDYKLMCFNGKVYCTFVCGDRFSGDGLKVTFYDREWKRLPFTRHYPNLTRDVPRPKRYEQMIEFAEKLSEGLPFARIDFYEIDGRLFFGEITFFPGSGMEEFSPEEYDKILGDLITLPYKS
jgi:hypothetical protein